MGPEELQGLSIDWRVMYADVLRLDQCRTLVDSALSTIIPFLYRLRSHVVFTLHSMR